MPSEGFVPPDMTATQPTDARLRDALLKEIPRLRVPSEDAARAYIDAPRVIAALDTLIQYHRQDAAAEYARETFGKSGWPHEYRYSIHSENCRACKLLAAAQARLAAYEEER